MTAKRLTEPDIRARVEARVAAAGSLRALALEWEISPAYLSDFLNGRRGPGPQILKPLGLVRVVEVRYVPGETTGRRGQVRRAKAD